MKLAIVSDIHSNIEALSATLKDASGMGADHVLCLGDIVGYNASPAECIALLQERGAVCIAGNHDRAVSGQISTDGFGALGTRAVHWSRRHLEPDAMSFLAGLPLKTVVPGEVVAVHGALHPDFGCETLRLDDDNKRRASFDALAKRYTGIRVCAFGHTHQLGIYEWQQGTVRSLLGEEICLKKDAYYLINPGSVGQSRSHDPRATYLILDTDDRRIIIRRVIYDWSACLAKSRRAGLLPPMSFLPNSLRAPLKECLRVVGLYSFAKERWAAGILRQRSRASAD